MTAGKSHYDLKGRSILVVEDLDYHRENARELLLGWGCKVIVAHNGKEAVDLFSDKPIDLCLMDIQMPVMDGLQATLHLRRLGAVFPIIALTGMGPGVMRKGKSAGMNDYLYKPYDPDDLKLKIIEHLT